MYPFIDISSIELNLKLARRLPRRIAYYHLAIPVGEDSDGITVALAHPDHPRVIDLLQTYFNKKLIPLCAAPDSIGTRLDIIWQDIEYRHTNRFLCLSIQKIIPDILHSFGQNLQVEFSSQIPTMPEQYDLIVAIDPDLSTAAALFRLPCSILVLQNLNQIPETMLQIMRGYMPDRYIMNWLIPLAQCYGTPVNLLTCTDKKPRSALRSSTAELLSASTDQRHHLQYCRSLLANAGIEGQVIIRQGTLKNTVMVELKEHPYSLIAIAAEAHGDFAYQIWEQTRLPAFLVSKP